MYQIIDSFRAPFKVNDYLYSSGLETLPATQKQPNEDILINVKNSFAQVKDKHNLE